MNMKEFYEKYKLNKYEFAEIAGVGAKTLVKYANGETIRKDSKERIEKAIRVAEKYNLVRPEYDHGRAFGWGYWYNHEFHESVREYKNNFKQLIAEES